MPKDTIDDDDIVFRDLDGSVDDLDNDKLKEQAENFENDKLLGADDFEIVDSDEEGGEEEEPEEVEESPKEEPKVDEELIRYKTRAEEAEKLIQEKNDALKKERAEIRKEREERLKIEEIAVESMYTKCESDLASARAELIRAKEEGETEKEFEAQEKYSELLTRKKRLQEHVERVKGAQESFKQSVAEYEASEKANPPRENVSSKGPNEAEPTEGGKKWIQNNAGWLFSDKATPAVKTFIAEADRLLAASGKNPNSTDYFDALNGMLKVNFPELTPVGINGAKAEAPLKEAAKKAPGFRPKSPVASVGSASSSTGNQTQSSNKVVITPADKASMRKFGMDPNNQAHLREWAQEKRSAR